MFYLQFLKHAGNKEVWVEVWTAWCWFHLGDYRRSLDLYLEISSREHLDARVKDTLPLDIAVCYFYLGTSSFLQPRGIQQTIFCISFSNRKA